MRKVPVLVQAELERLKKYNLFAALFVTLLFWVGIAWFFDSVQMQQFIPFIFLMDATVMTILLVGVTLSYEKQEHTVNSIMVSPVTEDEYLLAKVLVNVANSLFSVLFLSAALYLLKGITLNYLILVPAVLLVTVVHSLIGIKLAYHAKSFTAVLVNMIVYMFIFMLPSIFLLIGVLPEGLSSYLILLPPEASSILVGAAVKTEESWRLVAGFGYLTLLAALLYRYLVRPQFREYVMRETGV